MKYLLCIRVSTDRQDLGEDVQRTAGHAWIESNRHKYGDGEILEFIDRVTGTDRKRKELQERVKLVEALSLVDQGDVIVVHKRERLSRDPYIICMIERIIEKKKAILISTIGEMDGNEPHDILMRRIMDAFAEYEALLISTRTKLALARKKARGERLGRVPYGYTLDTDKQLVVCPEEAQTLKVMHGLRDQKLTFRQIADRLNAQGYKNRGSKGVKSRWTHGATSRVYKNYDGITVNV